MAEVPAGMEERWTKRRAVWARWTSGPARVSAGAARRCSISPDPPRRGDGAEALTDWCARSTIHVELCLQLAPAAVHTTCGVHSDGRCSRQAVWERCHPRYPRRLLDICSGRALELGGAEPADHCSRLTSVRSRFAHRRHDERIDLAASSVEVAYELGRELPCACTHTGELRLERRCQNSKALGRALVIALLRRHGRRERDWRSEDRSVGAKVTEDRRRVVWLIGRVYSSTLAVHEESDRFPVGCSVSVGDVERCALRPDQCTVHRCGGVGSRRGEVAQDVEELVRRELSIGLHLCFVLEQRY